MDEEKENNDDNKKPMMTNGLLDNSDHSSSNIPSHLINSVDGLNGSDSSSSRDRYDETDLPTALIVKGLPAAVFDNHELKQEFESLFRRYDSQAKFLYLKSFRRVRIDYGESEVATRARIELHEGELAGQTFTTYFIQPLYSSKPDDSSHHLEPPPLEKQFLISPPASPPVGWEQCHEAQPVLDVNILAAIAGLAPVGWEQCHEAQPVLDVNILAAIAGLAPGVDHEIYTPVGDIPGIVVSTCDVDDDVDDVVMMEDGDDDDDDDSGDDRGKKCRPKIQQTRCPERKLQ